MISRSFVSLCAILFYSATTVSATGGGLRKALQAAQQELMCQLATLHSTYISDDNEITHGEQTTCTLFEDGVLTPFAYPIVLPNEFLEQHHCKIEQGQLLVSIRGASLVAGECVLDDDFEITVLDGNFSPSTTRSLLETKDPRDAFGQRRLIAFRVNGVGGDKQVVNSTSEIHRALFDNGISVKTQYEKCSIDKFSWVSEGVHELYLPKALKSYASPLDARNAAYEQIKKSPTYKQSYGNMDVTEVAHNIMFCLPPHNWKKAFIANAHFGGTISTFSDKWCADLSTVVHELGHNLGRGHAGRNSNPYGDPSSNMGGSGNMASATGPQKCFNSAQNIEFGWYNDHILHFNPKVDSSKMIKLVSLVDVRLAGPANVEPVIIKIGKYSIQYNQAKSYNMGTGMANRVTIVTDTDATGVTWIQAELRPEDQQFTFSDSGKKVYVNYCGAVTGTTTTPDAVYIGIGIGRSACTTIPTAPPPSRPRPMPRPTPSPPIPPTPLIPVVDPPVVPDQIEDGDEDEEDEDEDEGSLECLSNPNTPVHFTLDDRPDGKQELIRCRNVISIYGSSVCGLKSLRRNYQAWPDGRQIKDVCQEECALAGNGMCDPRNHSAPPICLNRPKRLVYYGENQKSRCVFVNADICNQDALSKDLEPTGYKVYDLCQHQCADQAQCEAI